MTALPRARRIRAFTEAVLLPAVGGVIGASRPLMAASGLGTGLALSVGMQSVRPSGATKFWVCALLLLGFAQPVASRSSQGDAASAAPGLGALSAPWRFRLAPAPGGTSDNGLSAVAVRGDRIAIGDASGVSLSVGGGSYRHVIRSALVNDLHFGAEGDLWVAAADGLQHLTMNRRVSDRSPGTGVLARATLRVRELAGVLAVGTSAGLFLSHDGLHWSARVGSLPAAPVTALALQIDRSSNGASAEGERVEVWAVCGGFPWRLIVESSESGLQVAEARRVSIPGRPGGSAPVDVVLGLPGAPIVVVFAQAFAIAESFDGPWRIVRPVVAPGARLQRLVGVAGRVWLASDGGVLEADHIGAPFRRSGGPAGSAASRAFAASPQALWVASRVGLLEGRPAPSVAAAPRSQAARSRAALVPREWNARRVEPEIAAIHRAALRYLELGPERVRALRAGLDMRGWLPDLSVRVGYDTNHDDREDWDQAYVSGDTRRLYDYQRDRQRDLSTSVELSWDLGDTLYNSDAIELSREARQRIALRDDALDEINQLYFERRSVIARLAASPDVVDPLEAERLWLRAQELAAGLDGWTGGWFSSALAQGSP